MKRVCKQCGKSFELSDSEIAFYKSKNLNLPKRCKACRQANKQSKDVSGERDWSVQKQGAAMPDQRSMPNQQDNKVGKWVYVLIVASILLLFGVIRVSNHFFKADSAGPADMVENGNDSSYVSAGNENDSSDLPTENENDSSNVMAENGRSDVGEPPQENVADVEEMPQEKAADVEVMLQEEAADTEEMPQSETAGIEEAVPLQDAAGDVRDEADVEKQYTFRNDRMLKEHFEKHGQEMGFSSAEEYLAAANAVVNNTSALHKTEKEDGDDVYYLEATNEFVIVSTDGFIRTYFYPNAGIDYYNRQ